jgi:hypothetical protein
MFLQWINPLSDTRWSELVERHPRASIFHTRGWLQALQRTYGYQPVALTAGTLGSEFAGGMVFCRVKSWLTGRRLVSLPFSDHCDPLVRDGEEQEPWLDALRREQDREQWKYVELRPRHALSGPGGFVESQRYCLHWLDLRPDLETLFGSFHKNHVVRKIHRSEREKLTYEEGRSDRLLRLFYELLVQTRRRHRLPPQPFDWFRILLECMPERALVRVAFKDGAPTASVLSLRHRDVMFYKYGASDPTFHALGGMHLLFWRTIQDAREQGCVALDFGRSELQNEGLLAFKDHWGGRRCPLVYWRYPGAKTVEEQVIGRLARRVLSLAPDRLLIAAGRKLYRHIG